MTLEVDDALAVVLRHAPRLPAEEVALDEALGRVSGAELRSPTDLPAFDRVAMDGFALRAADAAVPGVCLPVTGALRAGHFPTHGPGPGEAWRVMTGAPLPPGADAVLPVERTQSLDGGRRVRCESAVERGQNVAARGSEVRSGELLLEAGWRLDPAALALLAAVGAVRVSVARRPRVAVLATGDELVDPADTPGPGQLRDSNGPALAALAREAGAAVVALGRVRDEPAALEAALARGLEQDVLLVSGGVSAGDFDLVEPALEALGVRKHFERVALKPGAPLVFGTRGPTLIFGLPGNPVSAQVTFELFARPALLALQGARAPLRPTLEVELAGPFANRSGRRAYLPAHVTPAGGGLRAQPLRSAGSADVRAHAVANALVVLAAGRTRAEPGERAPALLLGGFLAAPAPQAGPTEASS